MPIESELFRVGDRVRPLVQRLKSLDGKHTADVGWYTIASIEEKVEKGRSLLLLRFQVIEGEYHAHRFTKEPSKPTRQSA